MDESALLVALYAIDLGIDVGEAEREVLLERGYIQPRPAVDRQRGRARQTWPAGHEVTAAGREFLNDSEVDA